MGFGYKQAKEAGVPFRAERSAPQVNLDQFVSRHPIYAERVAQMLVAGRRSDSILDELREEGAEGYHCLGLGRDEPYDRLIYGEDRSKLVEDAEWNIRMRVFRCAQIWDLDVTTGEWSEAESWPDQQEG
jgi:hypothetical protein